MKFLRGKKLQIKLQSNLAVRLNDNFFLKTLFIIFILLSVKFTYSQELIYLNNLEDIENIKKESAGKVMVINFWATWCKPCVEEFPDLIKIHHDFKNDNVKLILISLDFKEDIDSKLYLFLKNNNVDFTTYHLEVRNPDDIINYFDKKWDGGIPATFIFDKSGNLQQYILGSRDFNFFEKEINKLK